MNRDTRDKFASGTGQADLTSGNACWETAPAVFEKLDRDFGPFDIDLTADGRRHLCPVWFGPDGVAPDALSAQWLHYGKNGYSNPPYGPFVAKMLAKAKIESIQYGVRSTLLLPMRVTKAFRAHVLDGADELWFCDKRLVFWENGAPRLNPRTGKPDCALFDSIIVRYAPGLRLTSQGPRVDVWEVPPHATIARRAA